MNPSPRYSRITGTGSYLPPRRCPTELATELARRGVETSDDWIVERTGIRAPLRRPGVNSQRPGPARRAPRWRRRREAEEIDLIIVATSTPDMVFPSTACILQHKLGMPAARPSTCRRCARASSTRWRWPTR
jgi:3-oxoacyl-[acyl-carrier-protein] synthase-3